MKNGQNTYNETRNTTATALLISMSHVPKTQVGMFQP